MVPCNGMIRFCENFARTMCFSCDVRPIIDKLDPIIVKLIKNHMTRKARKFSSPVISVIIKKTIGAIPTAVNILTVMRIRRITNKSRC